MRSKNIKNQHAVSASKIVGKSHNHELRQDDVIKSIAEAAYYKAETRGFCPGHEMDDWLSAEKEILQ